MCGIAGIVQLRDGPPPDADVALRMAGMLRHRGPDGAGFYADDRAAIAVRRLAIVAPAGGQQPIRAGDRVLVANGEVYDYGPVRARLEREGAAFVGDSDVEVLLHLLAGGGSERLADVNGQFALALWDAKEKRLLLARDPFGIAPLFYAVLPGALIFGSEIKALLQYPGLKRSLDPAALDQIAIFPGLVSPTTLFTDVHSLPPGCCLVADPGGVRIERYWDLDYPRADAARTPFAEEVAVAELGRLLDRAVARRLQGEAEIGLMLSGGLDSTLLAGILRRQEPERPIRAYSATFPGRRFDESRFQMAAAAALGLDLVQVPFDAGRIVDELPAMIAHAECPVRESYNVCSLVLARAARRDGIKVLIGGEGADELFAGYPGHHADALRDGEGALLLHPSDGAANWANGGLRYERDYSAFARRTRALYSAPVRAALEKRDALTITCPRRQALEGRHVQHQRSYLDVKLRLADHLLGDHGDRMVYASGVEPRFPFLDRDVVAFARRVPPQFNVKAGVEKHLLRRVAKRDVPAVLCSRRKYGFRGPGITDLLTDDRVLSWLSPQRLDRDGWFDPAVVAGLLASARARRWDVNPHVEDDFLMLVLSFNIFLDIFQPTLISL